MWAAGPDFGSQLERVPTSFLAPHPRLLSLKSNLASCIISPLVVGSKTERPGKVSDRRGVSPACTRFVVKDGSLICPQEELTASHTPS